MEEGLDQAEITNNIMVLEEVIDRENTPDLEGPAGSAGMAVEAAEVSTASDPSIGGWVWIVLFGFVIFLSLVSNLLLTYAVVTNRKKHNVVYLILLLMFVINLVDYGLLAFDFSLGIDHIYPLGLGEAACSMYQSVLKSNPVVQAGAVLILVHYAASNYVNNSSNANVNNRGHAGAAIDRHASRCARGRAQNFATFGLVLGILALIGFLVALPTAYLATIVQVKGQPGGGRFCEVDARSLTDDLDSQQKLISAYYLLYSSILPYWLPLLICLVPIARLLMSASSEKYPEVSVVIATATSFFMFYLMHAGIVTGRHTMDALGVDLNPYQNWMIKVAQSLLWLVAYFWHSTRPALAILLDADLKTSITDLFTFSWCQQQQSADSQDLMLPLQIRQQDKNNACIVLKKANLGEKNHQKSSLENANAEDFEKEQCLSPSDQNCV